jgi:hypothetical protein
MTECKRKFKDKSPTITSFKHNSSKNNNTITVLNSPSPKGHKSPNLRPSPARGHYLLHHQELAVTLGTSAVLDPLYAKVINVLMASFARSTTFYKLPSTRPTKLGGDCCSNVFLNLLDGTGGVAHTCGTPLVADMVPRTYENSAKGHVQLLHVHGVRKHL